MRVLYAISGDNEQNLCAKLLDSGYNFELYITSKFWDMQVRLASLVENGFNAVERISEYSNLSEEAPTNIDGSKPNGWPSRGLVGFLMLQSLWKIRGLR